jgi:hypothetical protein
LDDQDTATDDDINYTSGQSLPWKLLWNFIRDELSLQRFSMAKISSDPKQYFIQGLDGVTKPSERAEFDAKTAGISFGEWIHRLAPMLMKGYHSAYDREWQYQGMWFTVLSSTISILTSLDEWFDKMIPTSRDSPNAVCCTCEDKSRPSKYRCYQ